MEMKGGGYGLSLNFLEVSLWGFVANLLRKCWNKAS